jgi:hypothetical protein
MYGAISLGRQLSCLGMQAAWWLSVLADTSRKRNDQTQPHNNINPWGTKLFEACHFDPRIPLCAVVATSGLTGEYGYVSSTLCIKEHRCLLGCWAV